jgi:hypothetical protein
MRKEGNMNTKRVFFVIAALLIGAVAGVFAQNSVDKLYQGRIKSRMAMLAFDNQEALWFTDADTGQGIKGASVSIGGKTYTTDADGVAVFDALPDGTYPVTMRKVGYADVDESARSVFGKIIFNKFSVPKATAPKTITIVIDWGETPHDLDAHLVKEGAYHISYRDMKKADDGTAWLDRDDTDSYGPETITISTLDTHAVYHFFVHDYSDRNSQHNTRLGNSACAVRVYTDNRLKDKFFVSRGKVGTKWNVFDIRRGEITPVDTYE